MRVKAGSEGKGKKQWLKRTQGRYTGVNVLGSFHFPIFNSSPCISR